MNTHRIINSFFFYACYKWRKARNKKNFRERSNRDFPRLIASDGSYARLSTKSDYDKTHTRDMKRIYVELRVSLFLLSSGTAGTSSRARKWREMSNEGRVVCNNELSRDVGRSLCASRCKTDVGSGHTALNTISVDVVAPVNDVSCGLIRRFS